MEPFYLITTLGAEDRKKGIYGDIELPPMQVFFYIGGVLFIVRFYWSGA